MYIYIYMYTFIIHISIYIYNTYIALVLFTSMTWRPPPPPPFSQAPSTRPLSPRAPRAAPGAHWRRRWSEAGTRGTCEPRGATGLVRTFNPRIPWPLASGTRLWHVLFVFFSLFPWRPWPFVRKGECIWHSHDEKAWYVWTLSFSS